MSTGKRKRPNKANGRRPKQAQVGALPEISVAQPDTDAVPRFPIVGLGASAGGLAAFEAFFSGMPTDVDPGMAFVLVQHLAPDHKSILAELIRRYTRMRVIEVEDGMRVEVNCAYIIPPNRDMAFIHGALQLFEPTSHRGPRLPIDYFFRSLAQDQRDRAIGVVLSGTGMDGTLGVRAIKAEGGMVMVQSRDTTEFDSMPRSALDTGAVDYELPPAQMPAQLIAYAARAYGGAIASLSVPPNENALKKILVLLRASTGHDFGQYKPSTITRRIERRMAVHQIDAADGYVRFLQQTPHEVEALFRDLLIGVTSFFRDANVFKALEEHVISRLFEAKSAATAIRIWCPGCSTGEEAYSLAILLKERLDALKVNVGVQVFATDIDSRAITAARTGLYPSSIAADVSPERLARCFNLEPGGAYRIHKTIRDMLVFSEQDVLRDPPFSRLDLISCRNLLIYLGAEAQAKLIALFHYALNPGGWLLLGSSETVGEFRDLYSVADRKAKLFQRREDIGGKLRRVVPQMPLVETAHATVPRRTVHGTKRSARELTEQALLTQLAPVGALVNGTGEILYLHGRTGRYLEPAAGEAGLNIVKMAREGLRRELATALRKAAAGKGTVRVLGLRVKSNGDYSLVNLAVHRLGSDSAATEESALYLVMLDEAPVAPPTMPVVPANGGDGGTLTAAEVRIEALTRELRAKDEYIQTAQEDLETSTEELKSSNEEMQSVNEELQSTNEELETAKEEMQSVNEELSTVNTELQIKLADLARANNDMNNLLAGTGIGTVFVDHNLRILRFTPAASEIIRLIPGDIGRPVSDMSSLLVGYESMVADVRSVLDTLVPKSVEVRTISGKFFNMRIQVYRTVENVIEGAVITFLDVTDLVRAREDLRRLAVVVRDAHDAISVHDLEGRILAWNPGATRLFGWSEADALAMNLRDRVPASDRDGVGDTLRRLWRGEVLQPYRARRLTRDGAVLDVWVTSTALVTESGHAYAIAATERRVDAHTGDAP